MNPEIKARWVAALRSGNYAQGRHALRRVIDGKDKYCCLGVLCDIASQDGIGAWVESNDHLSSRRLWKDSSDVIGAALTPAVAEWAGISDDSEFAPRLKHNGCRHWAAHLNDGTDPGAKPLTFEQIADLIEEQL